jgi:hypothetical protein
MLSEQQKFWNLIKGPDHYAHVSAKEMLSVLNSGKKRKRYRAMYKNADVHFKTIMETFSIEQNTRILKTWLSSYQLPLDPDRLEYFDKFHTTHGEYIVNNSSDIRSY